MPQQRDRAWRRSQRAKKINRRRNRVPEVRPPNPVRLWQLHTTEGHPLPVFHREQSSRDRFWEPAQDKVVVLHHNYGCPTRGPYLRWEREGDQWVRVTVQPEGECQCRSLFPSWHTGPRSIVKAGMRWRVVKEYTPDSRPAAPGKLSKTAHPAPERKPHGKDKGWKVAYTHFYKVWLARHLGFDYPRRQLPEVAWWEETQSTGEGIGPKGSE